MTELMRRELAKLDAQIQEAGQTLRLLSSRRAGVLSWLEKHSPAPVRRKRTTGNSAPAEVIAAVKELLRASPKPLNSAELLQALRVKGLTINGTNPQMVLITMLWRGKVPNRPGQGYYLEKTDG